jgi:hypothetical protein
MLPLFFGGLSTLEVGGYTKMKTQKSSKKSSKKAAVNTSNAAGVVVKKDRTVGAHTPASEQCEHKSAKHHSRGKCTRCYNRIRNKKPAKKAAKKTALKKAAAKSVAAGK